MEKKVKYNNVCKNFNNIFEKPYKKEEKHKETDIFKEIRRWLNWKKYLIQLHICTYVYIEIHLKSKEIGHKGHGVFLFMKLIMCKMIGVLDWKGKN